MARIRQVGLDELRAAFERPEAPQVDALKTVDLADTLATRQLQRQKMVQELQAEVAKAKLEAAERRKVEQFGRLQAPITPASPAARIGGQEVPLSQVQGGADVAKNAEATRPAAISRLEAMLSPERVIDRTSKERAAKQEASDATSLQKLRGDQELEQIRLKASLEKPKGPSVSILKDEKNIDDSMLQLKQAKDLLKGIPTGLPTAGRSLLGNVSKGNMFAKERTYNQLKPALAVGLYRALTGDTRLSDADAQARALPILPELGEPDEVIKAKIAKIEEALRNRRQFVAQTKSQVSGRDLSQEQLEQLTQQTFPSLLSKPSLDSFISE